MNPNKDPNNRLSLDLSLGINDPQEQDPVDEQVPVGEQDPIEGQSKFMQLLTSPNVQPPLPPHHMMPPECYNVINNWNFSGTAFPPSPLLAVPLPPFQSPYPLSGQLLQPPQANQGGSVALEAPRQGTRLGRPPAGHQARRNSSRAAVAVERNAGEKEIVPPYPWATTRPAVIQNLRYLFSKNINVITGQVHCRPCENNQTLEYNLREKFDELFRYIKQNKEELRQRAPNVWLYPKLTPCRSCESEMKPVIGEKEEINWLFLLLGQMLGCCTLDQLRYFCDKTNQHRTGSKDRVLYSTYLCLCKQLDPCETFNPWFSGLFRVCFGVIIVCPLRGF